MAADDFIELVISERIGHDGEIVYDISVRARIKVYADSARILVAATTDIEDFLSLSDGNFIGFCFRLTH